MGPLARVRSGRSSLEQEVSHMFQGELKVGTVYRTESGWRIRIEAIHGRKLVCTTLDGAPEWENSVGRFRARVQGEDK